FLTLQRGNALGDAPRHKSAPRCTLRSVSLLTSRPGRSSSHPRARSGVRCRSLAGGPCSACLP
ncbi:hypothetical protein CCL07_19555, partial [Pseudomonas congelans]